MREQQVIGVGALLYSATFGLIAIATTSRDCSLALVDARVVHATGPRCTLTGTLCNASGAAMASRTVQLILLDRRGRHLASMRHRLPALPIGGCCALRSRRLGAETARFRIELIGSDGGSANALAVAGC